MIIADCHSHLNGEEYLIVHHNNLYAEIRDVILTVKAKNLIKKSEDKRNLGKLVYDQTKLNKAFKSKFNSKGWTQKHYSYYVSTDYPTVQEIVTLPPKEQKAFLINQGVKEPIRSYKQTDFVKENIAIEIQFGKYAFVAYDLFIKHMLFFSGGIINLGIEVLPMKSMQKDMDTGVAYYEGEVYNILRHGRSNPPVPLLIVPRQN
jgi:hypothetical protein